MAPPVIIKSSLGLYFICVFTIYLKSIFSKINTKKHQQQNVLQPSLFYTKKWPLRLANTGTMITSAPYTDQKSRRTHEEDPLDATISTKAAWLPPSEWEQHSLFSYTISWRLTDADMHIGTTHNHSNLLSGLFFDWSLTWHNISCLDCFAYVYTSVPQKTKVLISTWVGS